MDFGLLIRREACENIRDIRPPTFPAGLELPETSLPRSLGVPGFSPRTSAGAVRLGVRGKSDPSRVSPKLTFHVFRTDLAALSRRLGDPCGPG